MLLDPPRDREGAQQHGVFFSFPYTKKRKRGMIEAVGSLPRGSPPRAAVLFSKTSPRKEFTHPWGKAVSGRGVVSVSPLRRSH